MQQKIQIGVLSTAAKHQSGQWTAEGPSLPLSSPFHPRQYSMLAVSPATHDNKCIVLITTTTTIIKNRASD